MAITRRKDHNNCHVVAVLVTDENCLHYAKLCCKDHNKHIQWLNKADFETIVKITGKFENTQWQVFDKKNIKRTSNGNNGVKERPTRRLSKQDYTMQYKNGHLWNNAYSFKQ